MGLKILYIYYQPFPLDYSEIMFLRYKMSTKKDVKKFEFNELEEKKLNNLNHKKWNKYKIIYFK